MHKTDQSSLISGIEHEAGRLRVHFRRGGAYDYEDVPAEKIDGLKSAESTGRYFLQEIRPHHAGTRVPDDEVTVTTTDNHKEPKP